jgi:hypothetical protein
MQSLSFIRRGHNWASLEAVFNRAAHPRSSTATLAGPEANIHRREVSLLTRFLARCRPLSRPDL